MLNDVDTWKQGNIKPSIKSELSDKLIVCGLTENIQYTIKAINNPKLLENHPNPPKIGESISIRYDFVGDHFGREWLTLLIFRKDEKGNIHNYVRYFNNLKELEDALKDNTFEINKQFARKRWAVLQKEIDILCNDYDL